MGKKAKKTLKKKYQNLRKIAMLKLEFLTHKVFPHAKVKENSREDQTQKLRSYLKKSTKTFSLLENKSLK